MAPKKIRCNAKDCREAAQRIVGDCGFCNGHFCGKHRLLEDHKCSGLEDVSSFSSCILLFPRHAFKVVEHDETCPQQEARQKESWRFTGMVTRVWASIQASAGDGVQVQCSAPTLPTPAAPQKPPDYVTASRLGTGTGAHDAYMTGKMRLQLFFRGLLANKMDYSVKSSRTSATLPSSSRSEPRSFVASNGVVCHQPKPNQAEPTRPNQTKVPYTNPINTSPSSRGGTNEKPPPPCFYSFSPTHLTTISRYY